MIIRTDREVPAEWTDELCIELFEHARFLGQNGNPGGFMLTCSLKSYMAYTAEDGNHYIKPFDQWDFDGIRAWIAANPDSVRLTWQWSVR